VKSKAIAFQRLFHPESPHISAPAATLRTFARRLYLSMNLKYVALASAVRYQWSSASTHTEDSYKPDMSARFCGLNCSIRRPFKRYKRSPDLPRKLDRSDLSGHDFGPIDGLHGLQHDSASLAARLSSGSATPRAPRASLAFTRRSPEACASLKRPRRMCAASWQENAGTIPERDHLPAA
jgi:hypothetical protein